uniref:ANK_REP_REGION domain-containing protein n=1 Tax=Anopheles christyi TaxID=43041 RepID=A0A182K3U2_9DIPT
MTVLDVTRVPQDDAELKFRNSTSLQDNLQDLLTITDVFGSPQTVVYGTFSHDQRTVHFLRIEDTACAYDIFPTDVRIDLSNTLNITAAEGKTVLGKIVECHFDLETVKQLVQYGANPLLADIHGNTIIHSALCMLPEAALYLMEECLGRDLRNADGVAMLDLNDRMDGNKLIHTAASCGHQMALAKLLDLRIDATVPNAYGCTPAHVAAVVPLINTISTMKQLLDYDRTPVDMTDRNGGTLLMWAAKTGSIDMLDLIMKYKPNLTLPANRVPLYEAVQRHYIEWAKRFLQHAIDAGVREVTRMEDAADDVVIMSLKCADFELSKVLLEYELEHRLEEITVHDRPRIEAVLKASTSKIPQVPVELHLQLKGLSEGDNFLTYLRDLLAKLKDNEH